MADMLRAPHQDRNQILAADHAAIDADIHHAGIGILGDDAAVSHDVAATVGAIPLRHREFEKIDVVAFDDVLLDRPSLHHVRRYAASEQRAPDLDELALMGVGRQPEHHGDAARARQSAGEHLAAAGIGAVIADIVEQERRPGAGALRQPRDGAELDIPIDLGVDLLQFAGALERLHPTAQIAKRNRLSFCAH